MHSVCFRLCLVCAVSQLASCISQEGSYWPFLIIPCFLPCSFLKTLSPSLPLSLFQLLLAVRPLPSSHSFFFSSLSTCSSFHLSQEIESGFFTEGSRKKGSFYPRLISNFTGRNNRLKSLLLYPPLLLQLHTTFYHHYHHHHLNLHYCCYFFYN